MMVNKHVKNELSAYCHGVLPPDAAREVAAHLLSCQACRREYDEIKLGAQLAALLPRHPAPDSLWSRIESQLAQSVARIDAPVQESAPASPRQWYLKAVAAFLVVLGASVLFIWLYPESSRPSWEVSSLAGTPRIGATQLSATGRLQVGQWLETDGASRAKLTVAQIGYVEIDPNSRLRLLATSQTEHRLELAHGRLQAQIWAPPKLFFVETPSATAIDYGCAYTLEVDNHGIGLLQVTSGWVSLERDGRESMVPEGAACATRPGVGPGTPYFESASPTYRDALDKLDLKQGGARELQLILTQSRRQDTLTLWHLLSRVTPTERELVYKRLIALAPPPEGITREGVLQLDTAMLERYRQELEYYWFDFDAISSLQQSPLRPRTMRVLLGGQ